MGCFAHQLRCAQHHIVVEAERAAQVAVEGRDAELKTLQQAIHQRFFLGGDGRSFQFGQAQGFRFQQGFVGHCFGLGQQPGTLQQLVQKNSPALWLALAILLAVGKMQALFGAGHCNVKQAAAGLQGIRFAGEGEGVGQGKAVGAVVVARLPVVAVAI